MPSTKVRSRRTPSRVGKPRTGENHVRGVAGFRAGVVLCPGGTMIDVKTADQELQTYIRPQTFPVAIRMLKPGEPIPDRARRPARDFKKLSMNCQVIDMARRYGWTIALTREDSICSLGIAAMGFEKVTHLHNSGTLCEGMYTETKDRSEERRVGKECRSRWSPDH